MRTSGFGLAMLLCLSFGTAAVGQVSTTPRRLRVDVVFSTSIIQTTNRDDANAAIRIWADEVGGRRGFQMDTKIEILDDILGLRKRLQESMPGIVSLDTVEYLKLADLPGLEPTLSTVGADGRARRYVILVRNDSEISSFEMLRGKIVKFHAATRANLGQIWSDSLLYDGHLGAPDHFYGSAETVTKPSAAVLSVFFAKADSAIVEEENFETMKEMNPQIGTRLRVISTSPALVENIICASKAQDHRAELLDSVLKLHAGTEGKQLLTVFRFGRMIPIDLTALNQVRQMWLKHKQLVRTAESPKPPTTNPRIGDRP